MRLMCFAVRHCAGQCLSTPPSVDSLGRGERVSRSRLFSRCPHMASWDTIVYHSVGGSSAYLFLSCLSTKNGGEWSHCGDSSYNTICPNRFGNSDLVFSKPIIHLVVGRTDFEISEVLQFALLSYKIKKLVPITSPHSIYNNSIILVIYIDVLHLRDDIYKVS